MLSPNANLFLAIQKKIESLVDTNEEKYFRYVAQEMGQMENHNGNSRPPVSWPCVLIDIDGFTYENMGLNAQTGKGTVTLRLGFPPYSDNSNLAPDTYKEKALYYYDLEQILYTNLQGWVPTIPDQEEELQMADIFGHLMRKSSSTEQRNDFIRVRILDFALSIDDHSATHPQQYAPAALNLNVTIE